MRLTAALVAVLALAIAAPATARAGWKIDRAAEIAQIVWHPACGQLRIRFADPATSGAVDANGDPLADVSGWALPGDCDVSVSNKQSWTFETFCQTVLHEAGHAAGYGHSSNPHSVMYAWGTPVESRGTVNGRRVVRWTGVDPRCLHQGVPYLRLHGLAG